MISLLGDRTEDMYTPSVFLCSGQLEKSQMKPTRMDVGRLPSSQRSVRERPKSCPVFGSGVAVDAGSWQVVDSLRNTRFMKDRLFLTGFSSLSKKEVT